MHAISYESVEDVKWEHWFLYYTSLQRLSFMISLNYSSKWKLEINVRERERQIDR